MDMTGTIADFADRLRERFSNVAADCIIDHEQLTLVVPGEQLLPVCRALRDEEGFAFAQLSDLCGVDYSAYGEVDWETRKTTATGFSRGRYADIANHDGESRQTERRFAVVYHLLSIKHNRRLRLRCHLSGEPPRIASVTCIWSSADWFEREAFDLFGIVFDDHPDLRRILTDYGFIGHPFRKDFPLEGRVEVRYDPDKRRVVYQPVTIDNRVLVPRVIREDNRYIETAEEMPPEEAGDDA